MRIVLGLLGVLAVTVLATLASSGPSGEGSGAGIVIVPGPAEPRAEPGPRSWPAPTAPADAVRISAPDVPPATTAGRPDAGPPAAPPGYAYWTEAQPGVWARPAAFSDED